MNPLDPERLAAHKKLKALATMGVYSHSWRHVCETERGEKNDQYCNKL